MTDAVVVGAGIVGCATAFELARRGARVVLVDRAGVSEGTTGVGEGNALCSDKDAGPELDLAVAGLALFDELEALVGPAARIRRKGALVVHPDARTWAEEPARAGRLRSAGVACELVEDVTALEPELTGPVHGGLFVPGDLQCDPRAIARALAALAAEHGAEVRTGTEVVAVEPGAARLADGTALRASTVVVAAGPWSGALLPGLGIEPRKGQLVRLRLPQPDPAFLRRKVVDASYLLAVGSPDAGRALATVVETTWDGHVLVGSSRERVGFDPSVDPALGDELRALAARLVPAIAGLPQDASWVGFRSWRPRGLPAIGPVADGLWAATAHEGAGVVLGPVTGRLVAQALTGERPDLDLAPFTPSGDITGSSHSP